MKKAIKILGIIFAIIAGLSFIGFLILGISCLTVTTNDQLLMELTEQLNNGTTANPYTYEETRALFGMLSAYFIGAAITRAISCGFDITYAVLASKKKELSKYTWLALGLVGIICTNFVLGVISLVYAAQLGKESKNDPGVQEAKFTEKVNPTRPNPSDYDAPDHLD